MIIIISSIIVCLIEGIILSRKGLKKEFLVVCILLFAAVLIQIGINFDITLSYIFEKFLTPIGKMFLKKF